MKRSKRSDDRRNIKRRKEKFGYESNKGEPGEITDADRWILQIAYGY